MEARFRNRAEAGQLLASMLLRYRDEPDVLVIALPRGGVPVGFEVAKALDAPLDVFVVRKIGVPWQPELALGAIATGGVCVLNREMIDALQLPRESVERATGLARAELEQREVEIRGQRPTPPVEGRTVILVDDGLATGSTMRAAVEALRPQRAHRLIIAVPVAARSVCEQFRSLADDVVCVKTPEPFQAVGRWYEDFSQTNDEQVRDLLARAASFGKRPHDPPPETA